MSSSGHPEAESPAEDHEAVSAEEVALFATSLRKLLEGFVAQDLVPGQVREASPGDDDSRILDEIVALGWLSCVESDDRLVLAGPCGVELGRRLAPVSVIDALLGGALVVDGLVRHLSVPGIAVGIDSQSTLSRYEIRAADPVAYGDSTPVSAVLESREIGASQGRDASRRISAFVAATLGYLAGASTAVLDIALAHVHGREAFGKPLAALASVQAHLADAATAASGLVLLAGEESSWEQLCYAGDAATQVAAVCHQVTGALGYTLEFPVHRYSCRIRAVRLWADCVAERGTSQPDKRDEEPERGGQGRCHRSEAGPRSGVA